ncbi:MAG: hypothetical protein DIU52_000935 [bacterium]|jgi:hypothetical protein
MKRRKPFVIGRKTGRLVTLVVLGVARPPILGPWIMRAIVSAN